MLGTAGSLRKSIIASLEYPHQKSSKALKVALGAICLLIIVSAYSVGWIISTSNNTINNNVINSENLSIKGYDTEHLASVRKLAFQVENAGTTPIHVSGIKVTIYSDQSSIVLPSSSYNYDGTLSLEPNSEGSINLYFVSNSEAALSAFAPLAAQLTQIDVANLQSMLSSYVFKFAFFTATNQEYNYEITGPLSTVLSSTPSTIGFTGTTSATVTNVDFNSITENIGVTVKNTGTKTFTITTIKVNNTPVTFTTNSTIVPSGDGVSLVLTTNWSNGNTYKIDFYDGSNQAIGSTQQNAPGA